MRVAVFVGTRADLGPLEPVLQALDRDQSVDLLMLTGVAFGEDELSERVSPGLRSPAEVLSLAPPLQVDAAIEMAREGAKLAQGAANIMPDAAIDALVVLGDRWELLPVVSQAFLLGIPVVHVHGGELTEGAVDERVRHAVTKLADLHCVASPDSARRVSQLGESSDRIVITGAPGLDRIAGAEPLSREDLSALVGGEVLGSVALVTYHPETAGADGAPGSSAEKVLRAVLAQFDTVIVTSPGFDPGREEIIEAIGRVADEEPRLHFVPSFGPGFPRVLKSVDAVVGNSSAGIIEAPTAGAPTLDVGTRQQGRDRGPSVLHAECDDVSLRAALRTLGPRAPHGEGFPNPYERSGAAARIVDAIKLLPGLSPQKQFVDAVRGGTES